MSHKTDDDFIFHETGIICTSIVLAIKLNGFYVWHISLVCYVRVLLSTPLAKPTKTTGKQNLTYLMSYVP